MTIAGRKGVLAAVWFSAACLLLVRGLPYLGITDSPGVVGLEGWRVPVGALLALVIGALKGLTVLLKAARRATAEMEAAGPMAPLTTVFTPRMVGFVGLMILLGLAMRMAPYPPGIKAWVVGVGYPAISVALALGALAIVGIPRPVGDRTAGHRSR